MPVPLAVPIIAGVAGLLVTLRLVKKAKDEKASKEEEARKLPIIAQPKPIQQAKIQQAAIVASATLAQQQGLTQPQAQQLIDEGEATGFDVADEIIRNAGG